MNGQERCSLETIRVDVDVVASASLDGDGQIERDEAVEALMANIKYWQECQSYPYNCGTCGGCWQTWDDAKAHLAVRTSDGRIVRMEVGK
jgi:hypothetical protein